MNTLEIIGTLVGLIYLYLEYKGSIYLWIVGIVMPAIYIKLYYDTGLYADMACNLYYLAAAVYGLAVWLLVRKKLATEGKKPQMPITQMPAKYWVGYVVLLGILFVGIGYGLDRYTDSTVPYLDSFTTSLSILAMWQLAQKYVEQWLAWILVDAVSAGLYVYKGLTLTAALYFLYTLIAIAGYFKWKKMMIQSK